MKLRTPILVALMLAVSLPAAAARPWQQAPQPPPAIGQVPEISAGEIQRWFDAYALVQAQEALQLSDAQYGRFITRLKTLQEVRRRNQQARNRMIVDLRQLINPQNATPPDETSVRELLKGLRDQDERTAVELRKAYDAVDEVLDVRQQARFRLFEEQMERRKLELLMRARQNARRGRGAA